MLHLQYESAVEENLCLASLLTGKSCNDYRLRLTIGERHRAWAEQWLATRGLRGRAIIGFHVGGSTNKNHVHKRWPAEYYGELGRLLSEKCNATILLFGDPTEEDLKARIAAKIGPAALLVHTPDILQTCALMMRCAYFVSNDSALLHLARALEIPTSGIFGPTNAQWVRAPGMDCHEIQLGLPCQPCFYYSPRHLRCSKGDFHCLRDLTPEYVAKEILTRMESIGVAPSTRATESM